MRNKNKALILTTVLVFLQLLIFSGISFPSVVGSKHDMSFLTGSGTFKSLNVEETCIFCHTPHRAKVSDDHGNNLPLWNRTQGIGTGNEKTYNLYDSETFDAKGLQSAADRQPRGVSLLCLSCHDGTTALNVLINNGGYDMTMNGNSKLSEIYYPGGVGYPGANISGNYAGNPNVNQLGDDHPISIIFDTNLRNADNNGLGLNDPATIAPLKLYSTRLECATCHDPHEQGNEPAGTFPFLRMSNLNSAMCLKCHNK